MQSFLNSNAPSFCIYHGNCVDGFGAAYAVWLRYGTDVIYHAGSFQEKIPDVTNHHVVLVDFSYRRSVIEKMLETAASITIIDHHHSAQEELLPLIREGRIGGVFDMKKSGAILTWEWFHPGVKVPKLLEHIEDQDLAKYVLPYTHEIQSSLFSYPYDFTIWHKLMQESELEHLISDGQTIDRRHFKAIEELLKVCTRPMKIGGYTVPVANLPYVFTSDAAPILAEGHPFAGCYFDTKHGRVFGLRSGDKGIDVAEIAKKYGGGGHKHAAGFTVPMGWEGDQ